MCDIQTGDVITRDYLPNVPTEDPSRPLRLKAFHREGMRAPDGASVETAAGTEAEAEARTTDTAQSSTFASVPTPGPAPAPAPVPTSVPSLETPLEWSAAEENLSVIVKDKSKALKVYCDRPDHLNPSLMHPTQRIVLVSTPVQADVLYLIDHTISAPGVW